MDIEARIAQLKAQIAEKEAYQKKLQDSYSNPYKKHSYANTWDYVVEGNRAGYDKEDAEASAYQKLLMEQAQADKIRAEQAYNTAYENKLNRDNALAIANQNKVNEAEAKKDEYIRGRNKAASVLQYAQQALVLDPNNNQLKKEEQLAKEDFDFYDRKLGGQGYDNIKVQTVEQSNGLTNNQVESIVKAILDSPTYTNEIRNKLIVLREYVKDPVIKEQIDTVLSKKGATKEDKDRDFKAAQDEFNRTGKYDYKLYKLDYSVDKNGQQIVKLVRK